MANLRFNNWPLRLLKVYSREENLFERFTTMFTSFTSLCLELYDWFLSLTFFFPTGQHYIKDFSKVWAA